MPSTQVLAFRAPSLALLATEPLRALFELCSASIGQPSTVQGDGHPVILYPGLGAGTLNTSQLRNHLRNCEFQVSDWGLGINTGPEGVFDDWLGALADSVREMHALHGRKVSLVGWSLGGVYAREIAKACPGSVRQVITLATPFNALSDANHAGTILKMMGGNTSKLTSDLQARLRERPPVPTTSIYSESDGMVSWQGCLQERARDLENIAVDASHIGMPGNPEVMRIVADRLAQAEGRWKPYRGRGAVVRARSTAPSRSQT